MKEIKQIIAAYDTAISQQKSVVLATVVHIEGSAYRAPGARMLIREDGFFTGAISGGCLEGDVLRKALMVISELRPTLITYDTSDEKGNNGIGASLGCNGIIRILIEPVDQEDEKNPLNLLRVSVKERTPSILVTFFTPENKKSTQQGTKLLLKEDNPIVTSVRLPVEPTQCYPDIKQAFATRSSSFVHYEQTGDTVHAFYQYISPNYSLIIAGAGNDVIPVVQIAEILGWDVTLIDGRAAYNTVERFPGCQLMTGSPEEIWKDIQTDPQTAIVLMSHNYAYDKAFLKLVLNSDAAYIGLLGTPGKRDKMFMELKEEGISLSAWQKERVFGPTGINIGAETSEEIALSIVSEIKAVFAGAPSDASLRNQEKSVHNRRTRICASLKTYGILILAAGSSKRLGTPKQQLIYQGDTLLRNAVKAATAIDAGATIVVTTSAIDTLLEPNEPGIDIIVNEESAEGMSSSIRAGVRQFQQAYPFIQRILIMLCDQPYADASHLRRLIHQQQISDAAITASLYSGRKGVPAIFHSSVFSDLLSLKGDTGAKHLIEQFGEKVAIVSFPKGAIDIDTTAMYEELVSGENTEGGML
jgi:xanthine/CO dehydrogenase XdhC/CoxF family maturation factor/CTP:molybdopterin cytidylyltransferase MocA